MHSNDTCYLRLRTLINVSVVMARCGVDLPACALSLQYSTLFNKVSMNSLYLFLEGEVPNGAVYS